jgi:hypothetical protein
MSKFKVIKSRNLPNAACYQYYTYFRNALTAAPEAVRQDVMTILTSFNQWLATLAAIIRWTQKSDLTEAIKEADKRMDDDYMGFRFQVTACTHSGSANVAEAARRIDIMLKEFGSITKKSYEEELGDVQLILESLFGSYSADVGTIAATSWRNHLKESYDALLKLINQRNEQQKQKPPQDAKTVRTELRLRYEEMTEVLNGKAIVQHGVFDTFIDSVNVEIERVNTTFAHTKTDISTCQPEPIADQQYTGYPVTPTPSVLFVTPHSGTIKLELGRDYNLTYKSNVEVGNAECTIHGKGQYRNKKTVTFIIKR